jgi:hypothetical protein
VIAKTKAAMIAESVFFMPIVQVTASDLLFIHLKVHCAMRELG